MLTHSGRRLQGGTFLKHRTLPSYLFLSITRLFVLYVRILRLTRILTIDLHVEKLEVSHKRTLVNTGLVTLNKTTPKQISMHSRSEFWEYQRF